jgi:hypothetical protein
LLNDNEPHIMLFTWTAGGDTIVEVDGYAHGAPDLSGVKSITKSRMMMGTDEGVNPFRGDIAEVRFYNNRNLSAEQRRQLGPIGTTTASNRWAIETKETLPLPCKRDSARVRRLAQYGRDRSDTSQANHQRWPVRSMEHYA